MVGEWWHFVPERVVVTAGGSPDGSFGLRATQQLPNWLPGREQDEEIRILIPLFPPQTLSVPLWMKSPSSRRAREPVGCRLQTSVSWGTEQGGDGAKRADRESPAQASPFCPLVFTHTGSRKLTFLTRETPVFSVAASSLFILPPETTTRVLHTKSQRKNSKQNCCNVCTCSSKAKAPVR